MPFTVRALLNGTEIGTVTRNDVRYNVAYGIAGWFRFGPLRFTSPVTGVGTLTFRDVTSPRTDDLIRFGYTVVLTVYIVQ